MNKIYFLFIYLTVSFNSNSQNIFTGKIVDKDTQQPIKDAAIIIFKTAYGTFSKHDGTFEIHSKKKNLNLYISHVSYGLQFFTLSYKTKFAQIEINTRPYFIKNINIRLGEYSGPNSFLNFDEQEFVHNYDSRKLPEIVESETEFVIIENPPEFFGGHQNLEAYLATFFRYLPKMKEEKVDGFVYLYLNIDEYGKATFHDIKLIAGIINQEVISEFHRIIEIMPKWYPAMQRGTPVPSQILIPIDYGGWD